MIDVLVVGAGPTGLTLACELARRGVRMRIVERAQVPVAASRAKTIQPRSLEVMDDLGVSAQILGRGAVHVPTVHHDLRTGEVTEQDIVAGVEPSAAVPYPAPVWIAEPQVEAVLRERLGRPVEFGSAATGISQDADGVTVTLADGGTIRARYVVGADGGRSTIRRSAGIEMVEMADDVPLRWWLGDVRLDGLDRAKQHVWSGPEIGLLSLFPLPGTDIWQFQASVRPGEEGEPTIELYRRILAERTGRADLSLRGAGWLSLYQIRVAIAETFRVGRVFLAGDAAHVHSPAGGQGMNTGIQDGYNLGWKLAAALAGADPGLLDTYDTERRPVARAVIEDTIGRGQRVMGALAQGKVSLGSLTDDFTTGLTIAYPDGVERHPDGPTPHGSYFDLFRGPHWTLLAYGKDPKISHPGVRTFVLDRGDGDELVLVRPDGYVASRGSDADVVVRYLNRWAR